MFMEELIKKADSTKSFMGEACFITAFLGIGLSGMNAIFTPLIKDSWWYWLLSVPAFAE